MAFYTAPRRLWLTMFLTSLTAIVPVGAQSGSVQLPSGPLKFGAFAASFNADGSFHLEGWGWPAMNGTWKLQGDEITLLLPDKPPKGCDGPGKYRVTVQDQHPSFEAISDDCMPRRMILNGSTWMGAGETKVIPGRHILTTSTARPPKNPEPGPAGANWPSFRGKDHSGIAEDQHLPDKWDGKTGENVLWRTPIPGLAHSSPIVWGQQIFVTSAVSSDPKATFKPGLYGDGDASEDRSSQKWTLFALDKKSGKILWERVAYQGVPREKRHIKSTYASSTPATDGRIVVAWFGSQGVYAYDLNGHPLWKVDLGRLNLGAYDIPTYEWGTASSPIIWENLVILQCDNQDDSFLIALDAETGAQVWKTEREELPSWSTPAIGMTSKGPELVTNAPNFIRGYDPRTGKELWRMGHSSKITAPTPLYSGDQFLIASGRQPERPIFAVKAGARGDVTLPEGKTSNDAVVWSRTGRGPYMPTPLLYEGLLYVLNNNGLFDCYDWKTGEEIYRHRLPVVGSGFSASPIAADGKIYLSNEDGDMLVIAAGRKFEQLGMNSIGELLMATPALSEGVMYVRSAQGVLAVGRKR
jgi:outer membrane protein assembly factor BamB